MRKQIPAVGLGREAVAAAMQEMTRNDIDWRRGRSPVFVFQATQDVYEVGRDTFMEYFTENALGGARAFLGIGQMEREVVEMGLGLLHAPEGGAGSMTTGGTESLLLALKCCRDWTRANRPRVRRPNIVVPVSAHAAFDKACHLMDIEVRRTALDDGCRADVAALAAGIDDQTMLVAGSAPCFPHGVVDPIDALSELALAKDVWLHVDACVGGYIAPFARKLGYPVPGFDFALPGVRSISADLHKFGHSPKPASTIFYRDASYHQYQKFDHAEWSGARMITQTYVGTRPGGAVAAAWAVMNYLGESGYLDITRRIMEMATQYVDGINAIDGLQVVGRPNLSIVTYRSIAPGLEIGTVAERLRANGWLVSMSRQPQSVLLMMSLLHEPVRGEYLSDLRDAVAAASNDTAVQELRYS